MPEHDQKIPVADHGPADGQPTSKQMRPASRIGSLRIRLLIAFVLITLVPLIVVGVVSTYYSTQNFREQTTNQLDLVDRLKENQIANWLQDLNLSLNAEIERDRDLQNLPKLLQTVPSSTDFKLAYAVQSSRFKATLAVDEDYQELFLINNDGLVVLSTDSAHEGTNLHDQSFFQAAQQSPYVQPLTVAMSGETSLLLLRPVYGYNDVLGVIAARVNLNKLQQIVGDTTGLGQTGDTYLVDARSNLLLNSRRHTLFPGEVRPIYTAAVSAALDQHAKVSDAYPNYDGVQVLGVAYWLPSLQVALVTEINESEALATSSTTVAINLGLTILALALAVVAALLITRSIANPIGRLANIASRIAGGELGLTADVQRHDEVGKLAEAFNSMTAQLRGVIGSLEKSVAERTAQLQAGADVSRAVTSLLDIDLLLSEVAQLIAERFNLYYAAVFLIDEPNQYAVLKAATGSAGQTLLERGHQLELGGQSMVSAAISARLPRIAQDVSAEIVRFANPLLTETQSELALPLLVGNRAIGALDVQSTQPGTFESGLVTILQGLADQVAIAVNNAQQFQTAQADARQAMMLYETSQAASFIGEGLISAVNRLFGVVATRADFAAWAATRFDAENRVYTVLTAFDANEPLPSEEVDQSFSIDQEYDTPASLAIRTGQPVIMNDPTTDPQATRWLPAQSLSNAKVVCVPAMIGDRILGTISLGRASTESDIGPRDVQLAQVLANQLAATIENRRLFAESQAAVAELNQLMALYTRQGWSQFAQSRQGAGLQQEYSQPTAKPLDPDILPQIEQVVQTRQTHPITYDGQSVVGVPITLRGEVLGTLAVQDDRDRQWTEDELVTLQAVADQVAQSIEGARLLEESENSLSETTTLYEVTRELSATPTLEAALQLFVKTIHQRLQADQVGLILFDETGDYGTLVAEAVPTMEGPTLRMPIGDNPVRKTLRPVEVYDFVHDPRTAEITGMLATRGIKSMLVVPLVVGQKTIGSFGVDSTQSQRRFTESEIAFCEALARQAANTIERYRLFEQTQQSLQETMTLYQASRLVSAAQTSSDIIRAFSEHLVTPDIDRVVLAEIDPDSPSDNLDAVVSAAWERDNPQPAVIGNHWSPKQLPFIQQSLADVLAIENVSTATELDPISRHVFDNILGVKSLAIIPLLVGTRPIGWVLVETLRKPYHFSESELRQYRTLAGQATVALENRRLFHNVEARVGELTVLTRISRRLASTLDLDEIMLLVVEEATNVTPATRGSIALYNDAEEALEMRFMRGYSDDVQQRTLGLMLHRGEGLHGRLLTTGRAVLVNDVTQDAAYVEFDPSTRSEFILPIKQGELLLGALNLESSRPNAFSETDVRLVEALADQVAIAITNARAYEAERQAVERIREADRLKTQFLANMSHELRTPLNSIIGFSRVILRGIDGPISELQQTDLTSIYNSGQHLLSLINNILDLSKIDAGKMELSIEAVDLRDIAKSVMSTAIALVKDKPVKLEQDVPDDLPTVMADSTRVRQIMLNLVSNAAKFTERGVIALRIVPFAKEVRISVSDTGIGVSPDKAENIFEEFTQADASTTRRYGGTGLGLAITKKFVEMHKGRIWVESQVGVGATFTFTLPREQPIEEPEPTISLPSDLEARGEGKKLILCIDDDPGVITLYKRYLEKQGYRVIGLTNSSNAVEEARRLLPFAITLDVLMPGRDGWDVLADLKKTPEIANTPIVLCSIIQDKTKGYSLGAADYLVKPITESELLGALERVRHNTDIHRVLIVDDEPNALNLLRRLLEAEPNYEVIEASGGAEALAVVQQDKPDLMILDLMMPDIDGFAVLDNIKSSSLTRNIPVIIVTAKELTAEDRARLQGKTVALFNKGMFTAEQLLADIVNALKAMNGAEVTVLAGQG